MCTFPKIAHGRLLNVGQFIEARAKLSWTTDPKATVEIPIVVVAAPESLTPVTKSRPASLVGWIVGLVLGLLLLVPLLLLLGMVILFIVPPGMARLGQELQAHGYSGVESRGPPPEGV